ncbi:hypothetical protein MHX62_02585 [Corynebacterium sp. ACRQM]|jgi:hypothetical protein|uniref:DUF6779 domain-containing protein n=1 Tax=Corynebacterium TaxID=1716 RepID=UPI001EF44ED6|nr:MULTISPECIES: DUF6779 domain-containing protein [Corynebacterium]MCG7242566.1 hypothetical protein [Corynebacterium sp. ACRPS]MCG7270959.1 hypothetical protein [Corynebacterium sp. ACRQM]MCG7233503.1 hypothetical protein [Corynebacterium sp. ACRPR]MDK8473211.1 hypothetical protein [Corynebacterium sp. MSK078]WKS60577.1 hypothetical protein NLL43_01295 [Corynebacterium accolens]
MTQPRSSSKNSSSSPDLGQIGIIALVILAVIASIVMLISGSAAALKIALIAALWAAVVGFFLVMRYRRQAEESVTKLELQERAHRAELKQARAAEGKELPDQQILDEIRTELASIRKQIEDLSGHEFTYEPAALHAEARRIMELEAQTAAASHRREEDIDFEQASSGAPSADAIAGRLGNQPSGAHADSNPLNEIISENTRAQRSTGRTAEPLADAPKPATSSEAAGAKEPKDVSFDTGSFQAVRWDSGGDSNIKRQGSRQSGSGNAAHSGARGSHRKPEADTASEPASDAVTQNIPQQTTGKDAREEYKGSGHHVAAEQKQSASRRQQQTRGRRRSDEQRDGSVSVSELLAQMKKDK